MKQIKMGLLASMIMLFAGCGSVQPQFNSNDKHIIFVDKKPYRVPRGVKYSTPALNQANAQAIQKFGLTGCQQGDVSWSEENTANSFSAARQTGDVQKAKMIVQQAVRSGKMGCAQPISDKEYYYYLNRENQQNQQQQSSNQIENANFNASMASLQAQRAQSNLDHTIRVNNNMRGYY